MNDFQIQIATAFPDTQKLETPKDRTLYGDILTDQGVIKAYIKLGAVPDN